MRQYKNFERKVRDEKEIKKKRRKGQRIENMRGGEV